MAAVSDPLLGISGGSVLTVMLSLDTHTPMADGEGHLSVECCVSSDRATWLVSCMALGAVDANVSGGCACIREAALDCVVSVVVGTDSVMSVLVTEVNNGNDGVGWSDEGEELSAACVTGVTCDGGDSEVIAAVAWDGVVTCAGDAVAACEGLSVCHGAAM